MRVMQIILVFVELELLIVCVAPCMHSDHRYTFRGSILTE